MFYIEKAQTLPLQGIKREDDRQMIYVIIDFIIIIFFHACIRAAFKIGAKDFRVTNFWKKMVNFQIRATCNSFSFTAKIKEIQFYFLGHEGHSLGFTTTPFLLLAVQHWCSVITTNTI